MKITFEFDTAAENFMADELLRVQKANDMAGFIFELEQKGRDWYRNRADEPLNEDNLREFISMLYGKYGIELDKLYP